MPLFIWMGEILYRTRLSEDMFRGLAPWMGGLPGGLVHTNIVGCTVFAAVSGSSAATLTTVGKMSIPELRKRHYLEKMVIGTLAGAATLGLMIPPSLTLIVYGVTINESIRALFIAGILPGIVLAGMFMAYVAIMSKVSKSFNPDPEPKTSLGEDRQLSVSDPGDPVDHARDRIDVSRLGDGDRGRCLRCSGRFGSGSGARLSSWSTFTSSLMGATRTSAMIALILAGAAFLSLAMGFTGLPRGLAALIAEWELSRLQLLMALLVFYIILGCFLDGISSVVLTMAVVEPMIRQAGIDVIWFGIFIVVVVEMAQITPPIGFNLFVLQGMTKHDMGFIARAAIPMFMIMVLMVFVLILFPEIATWLPANMSPGPP